MGSAKRNMGQKKKVIIIGAIAAGTCAAAKIRRMDEEAEIVLYEKDKHISYATCGLPYLISGRIKKVSSLLINSVEGFEKRFHVKVKTQHEVLQIDPGKRRLKVRDMQTGQEFFDSYDSLLICTGSHVIDLDKNCIDGRRVFSLKTLEDALAIKRHIASLEKKERKAIIIGGGYIGLELLEALLEHGFEVTLLEKMDQILNQFDMEIVEYVQNHLEDNRIRLATGQMLSDILVDDEKVTCIDSNQQALEADLVFLGVGVRPEVSLAREAGISIGPGGGIMADKKLRTNIPDVYAAGDCVECENILSGDQRLYYLANIASRQGRTAAMNVCGADKRFTGALPSSIIKVLDVTLSKTGLGIKDCRRLDIDHDIIEGHFFSHSTYYPGAHMMHMILVYQKQDGRILGFEAVGKEGIDKRTDVLATAIKAGLKVWDLADIDFCYHPAYGSAKDPVNMLGLIGENIFRGDVRFISCHELRRKMEAGETFRLVDVRSQSEYEDGSIPGAVLMPIDEFRERMHALDKKEETVIYCRSSYRAYLAYRILANQGFHDIKCLNGSYLSWVRKV